MGTFVIGEVGEYVVLPALPSWRFYPDGRIYSLNKNRFLKICMTGIYPTVNGTYNGVKKTLKAHRLLAEAFIPNPEDKPQINHIDKNTHNYALDNLEWCTVSENTLWNYKTGQLPRKSNLSPTHKRKIMELHYGGWRQRDIGYIFGVSQQLISLIIRGKVKI